MVNPLIDLVESMIRQSIRLSELLVALNLKVDLLREDYRKMAADFTELVAATERTRGVEASALVFINGLNDELKRLKELADQTSSDPAVQAQIDAITAGLNTAAGPLASAIATNSGTTPPAPADTPTGGSGDTIAAGSGGTTETGEPPAGTPAPATPDPAA